MSGLEILEELQKLQTTEEMVAWLDKLSEGANMPTLKCLGCGGDTNTALCDWVEHNDYLPRKCWAKWDEVEESWVKGCGYDSLELGSFERDFATKYITTPSS